MTTDMPPLCPTELTPVRIIGHHNMLLFKQHLQIALTKDGGFPEKKLADKIGKDNRKAITDVLEELRENGFVPLGISKDGKIEWKIRVKSAVDVEFERGLPELENMTRDEMKVFSRAGYRKIIKGESV